MPKTDKAKNRNGIDCQGFVYGAYSDKCNAGSDLTHAIYAYSESTGCCNWVEVIPATVGQCTGLKDKNGKLIFEGDVIKGRGPDKMIVKWYFDGFKFESESSGCGMMIPDNYNMKIIGNIHDNPELLGCANQ